MRPIKFRAFFPATEEREAYMEYEVRLAQMFAVTEEYKEIKSNSTFYKLSGYLNEAIKEIPNLMQFTGLTDKNGKEIYEGDILVARYRGEQDGKAVVEWHETLWSPFPRCGCAHSPFDRALMGDEGYEMEVIGNVHENPELIKS